MFSKSIRPFPTQSSVLAGDSWITHSHLVIGSAADPDRLSGLKNIGPAVNGEMKLVGRHGWAASVPPGYAEYGQPPLGVRETLVHVRSDL